MLRTESHPSDENRGFKSDQKEVSAGLHGLACRLAM